MTFERVLQTGSQDILYARSINRLRHLYLEYAPQLASYLVLPSHDDSLEVRRRESMNTTWWQVFLSMAGMIALINSALAGAFFGLLLAVFSLPLAVCTAGGAVGFLLSVVIHQRVQWQEWNRVSLTLPTLFPSSPAAVEEGGA